MTDRPDPDALRELGETSTNVADAWAGAEEYLSQGLVVWVRRRVGTDHKTTVSAAIAACKLVIDLYPIDGTDAPAPKQYVDEMFAKIRRWLENPSNTNKEAVRSHLDTTRALHAWQGHNDSPPFWILEAVDHASLGVWAGGRSSYIVPLDFGTTAARAIGCVLHVLLVSGTPEAEAVRLVTEAVNSVVGDTP